VNTTAQKSESLGLPLTMRRSEGWELNTRPECQRSVRKSPHAGALDDVEWSRLIHASGSAADVPERFDHWVGSDARKKLDAENYLRNVAFVYGVWPASAPIVAAFVGLLDDGHLGGDTRPWLNSPHPGIRASAAMAEDLAGDGTAAEILRALFEGVVARHGKLDIVVHTPGAVLKKPLADFTDADFDHLIDLNTRSAFNTLRASARHLAGNGRYVVLSTTLTSVMTGRDPLAEAITRLDRH
jgi:Enoyl-(Acyl carrier protein) reductase